MEARTLTPSEKGGIAEMGVAWHATRLGIGVLRPAVEGLRYDLVFDLGDQLVRIQCKWASRSGAVVRVHTRTSRHTPRRGYVRTTYTSSEVDAVAGYCHELDKVYLLPAAIFEGQTMVHLRLDQARNNQSRFVHWAWQYELGAIAQLGERLHGMQEVVGSSPTSSTPPKAA